MSVGFYKTRSRYIEKGALLEILYGLSNRQYQETVWANGDVYSDINQDGDAIYLNTSFGELYDEGFLMFQEDIDTLLDEISDLTENFDTDTQSLTEILNDPLMIEIRQKADHAFKFIETSTSQNKDVYYASSIRVPLLDGTLPNIGTVTAEELLDGSFHILSVHNGPGENGDNNLTYKIGDIVRCQHSISNDIYQTLLWTAVEKVGFEEVIP